MDSTQLSKEQWLEGVRALSKNSAIDPLGVEIVDIDDETITLTMPITDHARQPLGMLHGGISMLLAESAASTHAAWGIDLREKVPVGIEINGSHLNSASDGTAKAMGKVVRRSRNLIVHQIEIFHVETGRQLTSARVTNYYKRINHAK